VVLNVNLRTVFDLCQRFGAPMVERGHGKIINIASITTYQGGLYVPAYTAAKGAIGQLTKALCNEWSGRGVNVNAIAPGYMDTDLNQALVGDPVRSEQILVIGELRGHVVVLAGCRKGRSWGTRRPCAFGEPEMPVNSASQLTVVRDEPPANV
jgi:NAD(P)-dependent dehydrogenase (short-subunit alcohol dehydrogenase family)